MIDILGHVAYLFLMTGTYLAARNQACGWAIRAVGSAAWLGLGVSMGLSSIWLWSAVFLFIDISSWAKWRQTKLEVQTFRRIDAQAQINKAAEDDEFWKEVARSRLPPEDEATDWDKEWEDERKL